MAAAWLWSPLAVLSLLLQVSLVQAGYEHSCYVDDRVPHHRGICGASLSNTVGQLCRMMGDRRRKRVGGSALASDGDEAQDTRLRNHLLSKRQAMSFLGKDQQQLQQQQQQQQQQQLRQQQQRGGPTSALSLMGMPPLLRKRAKTQGITCECCFNHCSVRELLQYC